MTLDDLVLAFPPQPWLYTLGRDQTSLQKKESIIFFHGMFAGAWCFLPWMYHFDSKGYDIFAIQLHGHGNHPGILSHTGLDDYLSSITKAVSTWQAWALRANSPGKITLIGHSMGGLLAQIWASKHPETVERLVLVTSAPPAGIRLRWRLLSRMWRYIPAMSAIWRNLR